MTIPSTPLILIVDDNPTNLAVLTEALSDASYEVAVATSGESAIAQLTYDLPDLILLDIMMPPGMDGFETCHRLKANPKTQTIPVVFMTALNDTQHKVKGLSLGAVDYITKPFQQEEVLARVKVHLTVRHLTQALEAQNQQLKALTENLESAVEARTAELQQAQVRLVQQEKLSMLGELVAGVAHEINNPLGCIAGNITPARTYIQDVVNILKMYQQRLPEPDGELLEALEAVDLDFVLEDLPKLLNSMRLGTDRIREISASLRSFARADTASRVPTDIHQGLDSTLLILQHRLKAEGDRAPIQVTKHYGDLPLVECYPGPINQVFMNLLANAIDAFEEHPELKNPTITIHTKPLGEDAIAIHIADNGPGIDQAMCDLLFDPQFTTKPVHKGTGLGLAISRQIIVEKHSGQLSCHSTLGQGAEFVIQLPIQAT